MPPHRDPVSHQLQRVVRLVLPAGQAGAHQERSIVRRHGGGVVLRPRGPRSCSSCAVSIRDNCGLEPDRACQGRYGAKQLLQLVRIASVGVDACEIILIERAAIGVGEPVGKPAHG
jgi:hypothetical protein